jgi:ribonuclease D
VSFSQEVFDVVAPEQLAQVARGLHGQTEVAVDVEADSMHHFRARLCFVQLGTLNQIFLLDTLAPNVRVQDITDFWANPAITKYFHAAGGDLTYLAEAGVRVKGLFDTHRAATLLGWEKVGLADLVFSHLEQKLKKEHQQADFSLRPLPTELREYIADDVRYLVEVGRRVRAACIEKDIEEEVLLDCQRMCDEAAERPDPATTGIPKLPKAGLAPAAKALGEALAKALHASRLSWAEAADVPMGRMLSNMAIGAIAVEPPTTLKELSKRAGVRGAFVREHGEAVLALVQTLQNATSAGPPAVAAKPNNKEARRREDALLEWRKTQATTRKVTPSVVLSNALVGDLATLAPQTLEALAQVPYIGAKRIKRDGVALLEMLRK